MPASNPKPKFVDVAQSLSRAEYLLGDLLRAVRTTRFDPVSSDDVNAVLVEVRLARRAYTAEQKRLNATREQIETKLTRIERKLSDTQTNMRFLARVRKGVKKRAKARGQGR